MPGLSAVYKQVVYTVMEVVMSLSSMSGSYPFGGRSIADRRGEWVRMSQVDYWLNMAVKHEAEGDIALAMSDLQWALRAEEREANW